MAMTTPTRRMRGRAFPLTAVVLLAACTADPAEPEPAATSAATSSPTGPAETPSQTAAPSPTAAPGPTGPFDPDAVGLDLEIVADGLESPVLVTAAEGTDRLFVVEQPGRIRLLEDGRLAPTPFLDIGDRLVYGGEQGLLGLALHPGFGDNGRFFVNYTDGDGDTVVSEFRADGAEATTADPGSERVLLRVDQPFANHNGGHLAFGPDGFLYVALGDGGSGGDPMGNGQRLDTLLGKILRIDVDRSPGGAAYGIPPDNPFVGRDGARPEIWAYGLRNPWRFSFDRETGTMWIGDVGQGSIEEIDIGRSSRGGVNYGWNTMEGTACFLPPTGCDERGLTLPVAEYRHDDGCAVTGGFVYRGSRWPNLIGAYLFADYCSGTIWGMDAARARAAPPAVLLESGMAISSFGEDAAGELYVTDHGKGRVLRIVAPAP